MNEREKEEICFLGTFPPRECGIATFTKDLVSSIDKRVSPLISSKIIAMNNNGVNIYNYPKKVFYQISDTTIDDYIVTAKKINENENIKLVCIQHEFGIFGGENGDYLLAFLEIIDKPVIITFHSILPKPSNDLKRVVRAISERVKEIIVMTEKGIEILRDDYDLDTPIRVIHHGIPKVSFETQETEKKNLGLDDKIVLSSFGMVNKGKGYEKVIEALPRIVKKYPNLVYLIVGETHPLVRKEEGERYRNFLTKKIKKLDLENHVKFYNKYLELSEIIKYLKATDIYISSGSNPDQITSGTLAYAMGCGRAVISTPFLHAKDAINEDRGLLVDYNNLVDSFEKGILKLLNNPDLKRKFEKENFYQTRKMTWQNIAEQYLEVFKEYIKLGKDGSAPLPKLDFTHLVNMTDDFGLIQFAIQSNPNVNSGYTLDDNARALLVCVKHYEEFREYKQLSLIEKYLSYMRFVQSKSGKLYNFVSKSKKIEKKWSEDAHGRAIWALGYLIASPSIPVDFKKDAELILSNALKPLESINSPRAISFTIQGLYYYSYMKKSRNIIEKIKNYSDKLIELYNNNYSENWAWFEPSLTYANSKLSEALFYSYLSTGNQKYLEVALESLNFLLSITFKDNIFIPIGQRGWFVKGKERSNYDQQPIDVAYMVETLILAYRITRDKKYKNLAFKVFQWFTGKNTLNQIVYDESTGGCYDGLGENTINVNQGAESTVSYLLARLSLGKLYV